MIVESLQLVSMALYQKIHLLIIFFVVFVLLPAISIKIRSRKYKAPYEGKVHPVTVIVPVHNEDYEIFERTIRSIADQNPDQVIVAIDSGDGRLIDIAKNYGAEIVSFPKRVGKRKALVEGWKRAKNEIIVHVDSDVFLKEKCLSEITKPFNDKNVVGVATSHESVRNGSRLSYILSTLIERNMEINMKALNENMIVVDGRCNAWRKSFLVSLEKEFLSDYWMGVRNEIGDDRFLSREAIKRGLKTVFQETAKIQVPAPKTFNEFLLQQVRWRRSGTKFWIKDLKETVFPNWIYTFKCATYYSAPFVFLVAVILDLLFFPLPFDMWSILWIPIFILVGVSLVTLVRQTIYFGKPIFPQWVVIQGLVGLFILFPVALYGAFTVRKQHLWMTRSYNSMIEDEDEEKAATKKSKKILGLFIIALMLVVPVFWIFSVVFAEEFTYG